MNGMMYCVLAQKLVEAQGSESEQNGSQMVVAQNFAKHKEILK
jgi:xanthine/CO dehydrogenase XdhC/CoxF family maturation factor